MGRGTNIFVGVPLVFSILFYGMTDLIEGSSNRDGNPTS
jgi:hypothetical protein